MSSTPSYHASIRRVTIGYAIPEVSSEPVALNAQFLDVPSRRMYVRAHVRARALRARIMRARSARAMRALMPLYPGALRAPWGLLLGHLGPRVAR